MSRESQLVDDAVDLLDVARRYKLPWSQGDGRDRPRQIHCPMHADSTPSARYYPATNSLYCWTCQKSAGPTGLVVALEGCNWHAAAELLAQWYNVDLTPDPDEEEARRLIALARGHQAPPTEADRADARRYAAMSRRAVGLTWEAVVPLLESYEQLDLTDVTPEMWLGAFQIEGLALQ